MGGTIDIPYVFSTGTILKDQVNADFAEVAAKFNALLARSAINVMDATYGAVGDGVTDDTNAVAAAIAACPSNGVVWFPAGKTFLTGQQTLKSNLSLAGYGATVKRKSSETGTLFDGSAGPLSMVQARGLSFDNNATVYPIFVFANGSTDLVWEDCQFSNDASTLVIQVLNGTALNQRIRVRKCSFTAAVAPENTDAVAIWEPVDVRFEENTITSAGSVVISQADCTSACEGVWVEGNRVVGTAGNGFLIRTSNGGTMRDVHFNFNTGKNVGTGATLKGLCVIGEAVTTSGTMYDVEIVGNRVKYFGSIAIAVGGTQATMRRVTVANNVIDGTDLSDNATTLASTGLNIVGVDGLTVTGGSVYGCGLSGIKLLAAAASGAPLKNFTVNGVVVDTCAQLTSGTPASECGLMITAGVSNGTVNGGVFKNTGGGLNTQAGIGTSTDATGGITGIAILGARCYDSRTTKYQEYGIRVGQTGPDASQPFQVTIDACNLAGNATASVYTNNTTDHGNRIGRNIGATDVFTAVAATVGASPWANHVLNVDKEVQVSGGTVSKIEVSLNGATFVDTGRTSGSFRVPASGQYRVTYTVAPTVVEFPAP